MIESAIIRLHIDYEKTYNVIQGGKFILVGMNSVGKSTILRAIYDAINTKNNNEREFIIFDELPVHRYVNSSTIFVESSSVGVKKESFMISNTTLKEELIERIVSCLTRLKHIEIVNVIEFINNKYKRKFGDLVFSYRNESLEISREGFPKNLSELTYAELKLLTIYFVLACKELFLICDDVDFSFHVTIQVDLIKNMLNFLSYDGLNAPFLVSTHSPSILIGYEDRMQEILR